MTMPSAPPPRSSGGGNSALRIIGILVLAGVLLCGLAGSCLLVVELIVPFFIQ